ncbi:MAG: helix-turn-helix transcriptional regulator [Spirochaetales bacterium]|nr:helix-turn-helix transcriptional regulator [Spirochaetales bacterium]
MPRFTTILKKFIFIIPLLIVIPAFIVLSLFNKPLIIFPRNEYKDRLKSYADDEMGGSSEIIDFVVLDNKIIFTYVLKKSQVSSFAGISFDVSLLDISSYDILTIQLASTLPARYIVTLMCFTSGKSRLSELDTLVHFNKTIDIKEANQTYRIDMNTMVKTEYNKKEKNIKKPAGSIHPTNLLFIHLKEMVNVDNIQENSWAFDKIKTVIIEEISFHKSYFLYYILLTGFVLVYYVFSFLFIQFRKKTGQVSDSGKKPNLPFIQLDVKTYQEEDIKKITDILNEYVFNPEFSIHMVYNMTGLSELRISRLIKVKYNLSFKQLLNSIRLKEAKRLLLQSDLKIYDIAFKIGYNNNTYFCKLFKNQFGITPKEFRGRDN